MCSGFWESLDSIFLQTALVRCTARACEIADISAGFMVSWVASGFFETSGCG